MKKDKKNKVEKNLIQRWVEFFEQSKIEMKKVTYPTDKQTLATCTSVLFLTFFIALYLGLVDIILSKVIQLILS